MSETLWAPKIRGAEALVLHALVSAAACGHTIAKQLAGSLPAQQRVDPYVLYPVLHKLRRQGLVTCRWECVPGQNLQAKYYALTDAATRQLHREGATCRSTGLESLTVATMMLVVIATSASTTMLADGKSASITIVVDNRADVRSDVLTRAMMHVVRILGAIGVDTSWTCIPPPSPAGFIVHVSIVPQLADWPSDRWTHPLGVAVTGDGDQNERIYVFYDQVVEFAGGSPVRVDVVLGHVTAHEIGHVLLPQTSHSESGIMRSPWDALDMGNADNGRLLFTAKEGALIRDRLRHCCPNTTAAASGK
jgi:DNA-binding PadR family transcriptional regulator